MASQAPFVQPPFSPYLTTKAFPLTGKGYGQIQAGYMVQQQALPGYGSTARINYLYNPSTVSSDYNMASASAQASLNFPNPNDNANLAIPLAQTVQWSLMFDRTFELWGNYGSDGAPTSTNGNANMTDASQVGCQVDVMAFMQFTGMFTGFNYASTTGQGGLTTAGTASGTTPSTSTPGGIMMMVPAYAYFGQSNVSDQMMYYGYINEWSVQYTHFTQYNIPMRCVISVYFTMLPNVSASTTPVIGNTAPGVSAPGVTSIPGVNAPLSGVSGR